MFTQCQYCGFQFKIDIVQLRATAGLVICDQCNKEFNAADGLLNEVSPASKMNEEAFQLNGSLRSEIDHVLNDEFIILAEEGEPVWGDIPIQNEEKKYVDENNGSPSQQIVASEIEKIQKSSKEEAQFSPSNSSIENHKTENEEGVKEVELLLNTLIEEEGVEQVAELETQEPFIKKPQTENEESVKEVELLLDTLIEEEGVEQVSELEMLESLLETQNEKENVESSSSLDISGVFLEQPNENEDVEKSSAHSDSNTVQWSVAILAMIALLAFQYTYSARNQLAEHNGLRAPLEMMCSILGCRIPFKKSVNEIQLVYKSVQEHVNVKDALIINATYVNKAPFVQSYPVLELVFFNMEQHAVMKRQFYPNEYLLDKNKIDDGIPPDVSIQAFLEIVDPGQDAVNFEFNFL